MKFWVVVENVLLYPTFLEGFLLMWLGNERTPTIWQIFVEYVHSMLADPLLTQIVPAIFFIPDSKAKDSLHYLFSFSNPQVVMNTESSWQVGIRSSFHLNFIHSKLFTYTIFFSTKSYLHNQIALSHTNYP